MESVIFFTLATVIVISALGVVWSTNPIHGILFLLTVFLSIAGLFFLGSAPFLALTQVLVYAGAITVLFLFAVMLTLPEIIGVKLLESRQVDLAALVTILLFISLLILLPSAFFLKLPKIPPQSLLVSTLAELLFRKHLFAFELASVVLLAALIGALYLLLEERSK